MKKTKTYYIKAYEDRMNRAFEQMQQEGVTDNDSHNFIYEQGDFNAEEIAGYYFQTYKDKALHYWLINTNGKHLHKISLQAGIIISNINE
jgi:hypothetical protein|tara:strand:+ start:3202 stop:3471 length:270 start_codon:yes stop_codon:yes gene_type:complete